MTTTTRTTELLKTAARFKGYGAPEGYRVSRCGDCAKAYTWKGGAARPGCPACGGVLSTTTRMLKAVPFIELAGELLEVAELMPSGLERAAAAEEFAAADLEARAAVIEAKIADGRLVADERHEGFLVERHADRHSSYSLVHVNAVAGLRERAGKMRAKAARYRRRAERLEVARAERDLERDLAICPACSHRHDGESCLCPECGQPAAAPGATCGRQACAR